MAKNINTRMSNMLSWRTNGDLQDESNREAGVGRRGVCGGGEGG